MPFPEAATLFSRYAKSGPPQAAPELPGPGEYGSCFLIVKVMNRIMAEHFGIPQGPEKKLTQGHADGETRGQDLSPSRRHPFPSSALPGSKAHEGSLRHE
ncbi:MAG: hypothetical protein WB541_10315 [Syntrophobacteraceae bacterium]